MEAARAMSITLMYGQRALILSSSTKQHHPHSLSCALSSLYTQWDQGIVTSKNIGKALTQHNIDSTDSRYQRIRTSHTNNAPTPPSRNISSIPSITLGHLPTKSFPQIIPPLGNEKSLPLKKNPLQHSSPLTNHRPSPSVSISFSTTAFPTQTPKPAPK